MAIAAQTGDEQGAHGRASFDRKDLAMALLGALAAGIPAFALRGFTVDDALIPARYAAHLASGQGYRFNAAGPVTDGVTPLGWAYLLEPFGHGGALAALAAAKALGAAAWIAAAALLAVAIGRSSERKARFGALALVACSAPLAAWSVAGLETGLVAALASLAVSLRALGRDTPGTTAAGLAAGLRPELLPWALVLALTPPATPGAAEGWPRRFGRLALSTLPFALVATIRGVVFGRLSPLSAVAKAPDASLGLKYAAACFLLTGPLALLAPIALRRTTPFVRGLVLSVAAHFVAVALAGGDWMPLSRLVVPVLPTVALAFAYLAAEVRWPFAVARLALALAGELFVMLTVGPGAARVGANRLGVIRELGPALGRGKVVATVDVGWVGAATEATVVDLAGVTDPAIARLPGGHTSKHITAELLDKRGVDVLVLLLDRDEALATPWTASGFARVVEARIAHIPGIESAFAPVAVGTIPQLRYVVLERTAPRIVAPEAPGSGEPLDPGEPLGL